MVGGWLCHRLMMLAGIDGTAEDSELSRAGPCMSR